MKKSALLTLTSLVQGQNRLHFTLSAKDLAANKDLKILDKAEVELVALRSGDKLLLEGAIDFRVEINCAICAETFVKNYSAPVHAEYIKQNPRLGRSILLTSDEIDRSYFQSETIDLLPLFHDIILLAIPIAPTCREECKGICPNCGVNLNYETCRCEKAATKA